MKRTYRFMLLLYPRGNRDRFAEEMAGVFEEARNERHYQGWVWYVRFTFSEIAGLIGGAASAWVDRRPVPAAPVASTSQQSLPQEIVEAQEQVDRNIAGMVHAISHHDYQGARRYSDEERRARDVLQLVRQKYGITG
jgi:hypothetical protein